MTNRPNFKTFHFHIQISYFCKLRLVFMFSATVTTFTNYIKSIIGSSFDVIWLQSISVTLL